VRTEIGTGTGAGAGAGGAGGYGGVEGGVRLEFEARVAVVGDGWGGVADGPRAGGGGAPAGRAVVVVAGDVVIRVGVGVEAWHVGWFGGGCVVVVVGRGEKGRWLLGWLI